MRFIRHRLFLTVLIMLLGTLLSMLLASQIALRTSLQQEGQNVQRQLGLYAQALLQRIDRYRTCPRCAGTRQPAQGGTEPSADSHRSRPLLNRKLEQANGASQASTLTLINLQGKAIAASNWRETHSNVGADYSFRPYVQQALANGSGALYGIGMTTGVALFLSKAIFGNDGSMLGLIAIKIALQELKANGSSRLIPCWLTDSHGVVFLGQAGPLALSLAAPADGAGCAGDGHALYMRTSACSRCNTA